MSAAAQAGSKDVDVTYEDQLKVNEFSRNNARLTELAQEIRARRSALETLTDAADEVEMAMEEGDVKLVVGESFVDVDEEFATEHLQSLIKVRPSCMVCFAVVSPYRLPAACVDVLCGRLPFRRN